MSFGMSTVNGPLSVIAQIEEERDWPRAVVMLAIYLEKHSYLATKEYFESLKIKIAKKDLERLHLLDYGFILLAAGKIGFEEFQTMKLINEVRNKFMHRKEKYRYKIGTKGKEEYLPLLKRGKELLQKLFTPQVFISRS
jgi:hypothetical protein